MCCDVGMPAQAKPTKAAEPVTPAAPTPQKRRFGLAPVAGALAALLVVIAGGAWWFLNANRPASVATNAPRLSMVVLPFANLSGDPAQDYLVDALTDELTTSLARLARLRGSFVIARNTAMTFKGKPVDAKAIGKDLGVRYILEGSVQPSGDQMRVNAQLIDAGSGEHLWAEQFDTPRADLLQTQDAIVRHLARAMDVQLIAAEAARLKRTPAANPDAQDLALQCEAAAYKSAYVVKEDYRLCEQALAIDPNNVLALTMLGVKFSMQAGVGISGDPKGDLERADELESKALGLDPDYAVAHLVKGNILQIQGRNEEAIVEHERALALDPSQVDAHANLGVDYLYLGEFDKSIQYADKAISMSLYDPALLYWYGIKAWANFGLKRYEVARPECEDGRLHYTVNAASANWRGAHRYDGSPCRRTTPAGFQDANYLAQGSVAMGRPQEIVPLCASSFRAAAQNSSDFRFRPVSADGSGTGSSVTVSTSPSA